MNNMYIALLILTMVPVVLYSAATSGEAESTVVDDIGAKNAHTESSMTITVLRRSEKRS